MMVKEKHLIFNLAISFMRFWAGNLTPCLNILYATHMYHMCCTKVVKEVGRHGDLENVGKSVTQSGAGKTR